MPLYCFVNIVTNEYREVFFGMNDKKEYHGEKEDDPNHCFNWKRVYTSPNMTMDTKINPFSGKDFLKKTQNAKTYGELFDLSKEMSSQRENKLGAPDPQAENAKKNFYKPKKQ